MYKLMALMLVGALAATTARTVVASDINFKMKTLAGKEIDLAKEYKGKVLLVVNVASKCGLTPHYEGLQALHKKYRGKGLCVVGVPCNQFRQQEPGTSEEIREFCTAKYGVTFDLFEKTEVNGPGACDLYKHLTTLTTTPKGPGKVSWNFEKFLIGRDGSVVARCEPRTKPNDATLIQAIEDELAK